jgi:hypothetical protein
MAAALCGTGIASSQSLSYSTYLGGEGSDVVTAVAADAAGNVYLGGYTNSTGFAAAAQVHSNVIAAACGGDENPYRCFDAFVARLDPTGKKVEWISLLGGSGDDFPTTIALDGEGNIFVAGYTNSPDLPGATGVPAGGSCGSAPCFDAFVARLEATGATWSRVMRLGGTGDDWAQALAVDASGDIAMAGTTTSADFPVTNAFQPDWRGGATESFVARFDWEGRLLFASFLGGSGDDSATSVMLTSGGEIMVAGSSNSPDLPATGPGYSGGTCGALASTFPCRDAFIARIVPGGPTLEALAYLGGTGDDEAHGLALDSEDRPTIVGTTTSQDFPVTGGAFQTSGDGFSTEAFVVRLDSSVSWPLYATYLGGAGADAAAGVAVDTSGRAYVAGTTYGSGFPVTTSLQASPGNFYDAYLSVLNPSGTGLESSVRLGGASHDRLHGVALDAYGNAILAGETFSADFPVARAAQPGFAGGSFDGFAARIALGGAAALYSPVSHLEFGEQRVSTTSSPQSLEITNVGGGELEIEDIATAGDFVVAGECPVVRPGEGCSMWVSFAPSARGASEGTLTLAHNGRGGTSRWMLAGTGVAPEILLSADRLSFEPQLVGTESRPRDLTLTNAGTASLELSGISTSGDFAQTNDCPASIPVAGSCKIQVRFAPTAVGAQEGSLAVRNGLPEETRRALLAGSGGDFKLITDAGERTVAAGESAVFALTAVPLGVLR